MRKLRLFVILMSILLCGCNPTPQPVKQLSWRQAMVEKLDEYSAYSREELAPYFAKVDLPYAPRQLAFLVFKKSKQFEIYARNSAQGRWHHVKTYPILAASGGAGPKLHEGDDQVPEGVYQISGMNPESRFDLSLHLNYPNAFDRQEALHDHRTHLGGNIFIHGDRRSIGCIALGDDAIQQIFPLVHSVGEHNVTVIIAPSDLRKGFPVANREHLPWVPTLYVRLRETLKQFPA